MVLCRLFKLSCFCALLLAGPALAQPRVQVSENEKAIFAFHRLSGQQPSYELIAAADEEYKTAPPELAEQILAESVIRLKTGFGMYDPGRDFLQIATNVMAQIQTAPNSPPVLIFRFPNSSNENYIPYFPYAYGDQDWIAMIVEDLPQFAQIPMSDEQYQYVKPYLPENGTYAEVRIFMRVRPRMADSTAPMLIDGVEQWLLMGDTAYISASVTDAAGGQLRLWEYSAPWYMSATEKDLLPLLGGR